MAAVRDFTIVELDGPVLRALSASVSGSGVSGVRWHSARLPEGLAGGDAGALGDWLAHQLRQAEMPRGRVILVVPRDEIVLKLLAVPAGDVSAQDLAGIVHLQMVRQLTMPLEGTAVDHVPGAPGQVLAGVLSKDRLERWRQVAEAGGMKVVRIAPRCCGVSAVLADLSLRRSGPVLGVCPAAGGVELVVIEEGRLVHARQVDLPVEPAGRAERVVVEAKRTWMSHAGAKADDLEAVAVLGDEAEDRRLAERCAAALGCVPEVVRATPVAALPPGVPAHDRGPLLALMGLLVEEAAGRRTLDFANPRRAPDRAADVRRQALVAALAGILVVGGFYVVADVQVGKARRELDLLRAKEKELAAEYAQFLTEHARISNVETWRSAGADWLAHLEGLGAKWPGAQGATLDDLSGHLVSRAEYQPRKGYPDGSWALRQQVSFDLSGRTADRDVVSALRDSTLQEGLFTVESRGADTPDRFSLRLTTSKPRPPVQADTPPVAGGTP